jgi:GAF domain-containing protein
MSGPHPEGGNDPEPGLDALLRLTRELLDGDFAMLSEITGGREVVRRAAGEWPVPGLGVGAALPLGETICQQFLEGRIGNAVGDVGADPRVRRLPPATELGVAAWIGVPIELSNAQLYMLCCLARETRPNFGEREVQLLRGLAESVRAELQATLR